jgi:N-acetylglucosaminyldiphosphoundecaprenol N-acetyl-beta-D-mannosaminyltransferase
MTARSTARWATSPRVGTRLLLNHNLHSAYLHDSDARFRALYGAADAVVIDGMPILWLAAARARVGPRSAFRVASPDWIHELAATSTPLRVFVYGATAASNARALATLRELLPTSTVSGVNGYIASSEAVAAIQVFQPDLVLVGLGMPRQEYFLLENLESLPPSTYATVGGAIDYIGGTTTLAPRWLGRVGLEWAWRLAHDPRRLANRYLVEPFALLARMLGRIVGIGRA